MAIHGLEMVVTNYLLTGMILQDPPSRINWVIPFGKLTFCKAQAMIAERKILLCKLPSSGESETIEIKPCSTIVYILGVSGKRFRQLTEKIVRRG